MTTSAPHRPCPRGPLISIEGITGVGKTYLTNRAVQALQEPPLLLEEFSRRTDSRRGLGDRLLQALRRASGDDPFLRGGAPTAEALVLMAIKRCDLDTVLPVLAGGRTVVEGRSVDSTAVCQAQLLHPHDPDTALETARALLALAGSYRPLPDLTILITDDADRAIDRAQRRDQRVFTPAQAAFMRAAGALFEHLAATDPARYRIVDLRGTDEHQAADLIRGWIRAAEAGLGCVREPWQAPPARCMYCRTEPAPT